jgi:hypothetical protein
MLESWKIRLLWVAFDRFNLLFPSDKAHAVKVTTFKPGEATQPIFQLLYGEITEFESPDFAKHPLW